MKNLRVSLLAASCMALPLALQASPCCAASSSNAAVLPLDLGNLVGGLTGSGAGSSGLLTGLPIISGLSSNGGLLGQVKQIAAQLPLVGLPVAQILDVVIKLLPGFTAEGFPIVYPLLFGKPNNYNHGILGAVVIVGPIVNSLPIVGPLLGDPKMSAAGGSGGLLGLPLGNLLGGGGSSAGGLLGGLPIVGGLLGGLTSGGKGLPIVGPLVGGLPLVGPLVGGLPIVGPLVVGSTTGKSNSNLLGGLLGGLGGNGTQGKGLVTGLVGGLPIVGGLLGNLPIVTPLVASLGL